MQLPNEYARIRRDWCIEADGHLLVEISTEDGAELEWAPVNQAKGATLHISQAKAFSWKEALTFLRGVARRDNGVPKLPFKSKGPAVLQMCLLQVDSSWSVTRYPETAARFARIAALGRLDPGDLGVLGFPADAYSLGSYELAMPPDADQPSDDARMTNEFYLHKNGQPEAEAETRCRMVVAAALKSAGFHSLAKALEESYDFRTRYVGQFADDQHRDRL